MNSNLLATAILLFIVQDPIGNVPLFIGMLRNVPPRRRFRIILRESLIGLAILMLFLFQGRHILALLQVSVPSLSIAGGVILFLIALTMIFKGAENLFQTSLNAEPMIVPLAVPLIAGPSSISTVMLVSAKAPSQMGFLILALTIAWSAGTLLLLLSGTVYRLLGDKVIMALERLMGLLLAMISVEMVMSGVRNLLTQGA